MLKDIKKCCYECGVSANVLTCLRDRANRPNKLAYSISTYHKDYCDFCGEDKAVTEVRDFFYPDFKLLQEVIKGSIEHNFGGIDPNKK